MNNSQLQSIIRTALKIVSGLLLAHGLNQTASVLNTPDVIGALTLILSLLWSHWAHASAPDSKAGAGAGGKTGLLLVLLSASFVFTGCSTLPENAFKAELAAATAGDAAMRGYSAYWNKAIANPPAYHRTADALNAEKEKICDASIKLGGSIELTESLRKSYATNSALATPLNAAVISLKSNAAQIVATTAMFLNLNLTNQ